jgi:glutathione S-transferase
MIKILQRMASTSVPKRPKMKIVGSYLSPYVRKVLVSLNIKGIPYEIDPIIPFFGNEKFGNISPLRRIPVLIDGGVTLSDSSVICQYLEDKFPTPSLFPTDIVERAQARWLEEYSDSRIGDVFIWNFYNEKIIKPIVWKKQGSDETIQKSIDKDIPSILAYLESQLLPSSFFFASEEQSRSLSIADVSIAAMFKNASFAKYKVDPSRWPKTAAFVQRVHADPAFEEIRKFETISLRTPIPQHRAALKEAGAPISEETYGTDRPIPGVMSRL